MDKAKVIAACRAKVQEEHDAVLAVAAMAVDEATSEDNRAENKYDTRGLEASYLAAGQARRIAELRQRLGFFDGLDGGRAMETAAVGALVQLEDDESDLWCFLAAGGGGETLTVDGVEIRILSPESPVGRALLGRRAGDEAVIRTPKGAREWEVVAVY